MNIIYATALTVLTPDWSESAVTSAGHKVFDSLVIEPKQLNF